MYNAIKCLKNDKSPGLDGILADIFKITKEMVGYSHTLFDIMWQEKSVVPKDLKKQQPCNIHLRK